MLHPIVMQGWFKYTPLGSIFAFIIKNALAFGIFTILLLMFWMSHLRRVDRIEVVKLRRGQRATIHKAWEDDTSVYWYEGPTGKRTLHKALKEGAPYKFLGAFNIPIYRYLVREDYDRTLLWAGAGDQQVNLSEWLQNLISKLPENLLKQKVSFKLNPHGRPVKMTLREILLTQIPTNVTIPWTTSGDVMETAVTEAEESKHNRTFLQMLGREALKAPITQRLFDFLFGIFFATALWFIALSQGWIGG